MPLAVTGFFRGGDILAQSAGDKYLSKDGQFPGKLGAQSGFQPAGSHAVRLSSQMAGCPRQPPSENLGLSTQLQLDFLPMYSAQFQA